MMDYNENKDIVYGLREVLTMYRILKAYRAARNEKQEDVIKFLGLKSVTAYSLKESGKGDFKLREAKLLADHYNTTIDHLFFGSEVHI